MDYSGIRIVIVGAVVICLVSAQTAEAAKGIKKNFPANKPQIVTGHILNVVLHDNSTGSIFLNTHLKNSNAANVQNGTAAKTKGQEFIARETTRLVTYNGSPAYPNQLKKGVRVRLTATGNSVSSVQILNRPHIRRGIVMRSGTNTYRHRYARFRSMYGALNMPIASHPSRPPQSHSTGQHVNRVSVSSVAHPVHHSSSAQGNHRHR